MSGAGGHATDVCGAIVQRGLSSQLAPSRVSRPDFGRATLKTEYKRELGASYIAITQPQAMAANPAKRRRTSKSGMLHACMRPGMLARGGLCPSRCSGHPTPTPPPAARANHSPRRAHRTGIRSRDKLRQGWCRARNGACERGTPPTSGQGPGGHAGLRGVALACSTAQWAGRELGCAQRREARDKLAGGSVRRAAGSQRPYRACPAQPSGLQYRPRHHCRFATASKAASLQLRRRPGSMATPSSSAR